ncbi:class I SAM-dependent methyltransferase [Pseudactinotalea sp.]|uniref:class I SAM-dependent methyltransferase n=1 Tax=Pseudactinotalea sp. TaxID=1926260 RepID=UPI003B3B8A67
MAVNVRTSESRLIRAVGRWLHRVNARHPWSHNDYFHGWIRRRLPHLGDPGSAALDVGCGRGLLARRLGRVYDGVLAIDVDPDMVAATRANAFHLPHVAVQQSSIEDVAGHDRFDAITMVAVLHHLDPSTALPAVRRLLRPGGRLLVVGLASLESAVDVAWDITSALTNPIIGFVLHPTPVREPEQRPAAFPTKDPTVSVRELRALLARELPGARLRRRLGFRHTIEWTKPT